VSLFLPFSFLCFTDGVQKQKLLRLGNLSILIIAGQSSVVPTSGTHTQTIVARAVPVTMDFKFLERGKKESF